PLILCLKPFPYTTPFRSQAHRLTSNRHRRPRPVIRHINREHHARLVIKLSDWFALTDAARLPRLHRDHTLILDPIPDPQPLTLRSEEHTSELQSRFDLVC